MLCDLDLVEAQSLRDGLRACAADGGAGGLAADDEGRDEEANFINQPSVAESAGDGCAAFDEDAMQCVPVEFCEHCRKIARVAL